jgi:uncharacterized protein (TIGR02453 family)
MAFSGWTDDFVGFFRGLELDNSKRYFDAHRRQYERDVLGPLKELTAELEPQLGNVKIFRINRDIRFSADKSPYKTNIAATIGPLYVHLDARRLFLGTGAHAPDNGWLQRFREAVAADPGETLARHVDELRNDGMLVGGNPLKTAPRGYSADHPRIELLRWREVVAGREFAIEPWIAEPVAKDRIVETWEDLRPFSDWLARHVPAEQPAT